jgi:hypothetical protein
MKKLLGVSLVAVFAATPLIAGAEVSTETVTLNNVVATTSFVQGAYNDLADHVNTNIGAINTNTSAINTLNGNASTTGSVAKSIKDNAASGSFDAEENYTAGTIGHAIKNTSATAIAGLNATESQTGAAANGGLNLSITEANGLITSISGSVDSGTYGAYGAASAAQTAAEDYAKDGSHFTSGTVAKTALASGVQSSLDLADSAVQSITTGATNGTVSVDGTDVPVYGLGTAAYAASNTFATAGSAAAAQTAAESYMDGKQLTVSTTWKSNATGTASLINTPSTFDYSQLISVNGDFTKYRSIDDSNNSDDITGLELGEWEVGWTNIGTAKGTSMCSSTGNDGEFVSYETTTDPLSADGETKSCWCKMTGFTDKDNTIYNQSSLWVYYNSLSTAYYCARSCAYVCGRDVRSLSAMRSGLFGSVQ